MYKLYFYRYGGQYVIYFASRAEAFRFAARKVYDGYLVPHCLLLPNGARVEGSDIIASYTKEYGPIAPPECIGVEEFDYDTWAIQATPTDAT